MKLFKLFAKDEDGAVTVDWVVLTSAIELLPNRWTVFGAI